MEVLARGPLAALPRNLSDRWLRLIGRDLSRAQKANLEGKDDESIDISVPLLIVAALLAEKRNVDLHDADISESEIMDGLANFQQAVVEEIVGRETGIFRVQFTMENIV